MSHFEPASSNTISLAESAVNMPRRAGLMLGGILFLFALLGARLTQLQYMEHASLSEVSQDQRASRLRWSPWRGPIVDACGRTLAVSVPVNSCAIDPLLVRTKGAGMEKTLDFLRTVLDLSPAKEDRIRRQSQKMVRVRGRERPIRFVWIGRQLADQKVQALQKGIRASRESDQPLRGIIFPSEYARKYPHQQIGAHLVGFVNIDGKGQEGIEWMADALMQGLPEARQVERDAHRRALVEDASMIDHDRRGLTVVMSMDATIQLITEKALAKAVKKYTPVSATAIVMDPYTGDVLALANYPTFDPNEPTATPTDHRLNQAIASIVEPGSTFKPFVFAVALEETSLDLQTRIHCENGAWRMACGRVLHDAHGYGVLTAEMVLVKSSNIGMAKIAAMMGRESLYNMVRRFGFGAKTEATVLGELVGQVHPLRRWTAYSMGSIPMGQELAVTPLQLANAYCVLANGGTLLRPRLVKEVKDREGNVVRSFPVYVKRRNLLKPETAAITRRVLRRVVTGGTGRRVNLAEYQLSGKTGTAQLPVNAAEMAAGHRGYSPDRYTATFVGIAPYHVPRLVVLTSIREPHGAHYGGVVAGPVVREISKKALLYMGEPMDTPLAAGGPGHD